jgi:hypothetical protein
MWHDLKWSPSEKKVARKAFDAALESVLYKVMAEFRMKANDLTQPSDLWDLEQFLRDRRQEIGRTFDYRYSQLPLVFAKLIREGHLDEGDLSGLSEEKLKVVRSFLTS